MSSINELDILKRHIRELSVEINGLKKQINPHMSPAEYIEVHNKFLNLSNLKALAKNELADRLHYYKVTLKGKKKSEAEFSKERTFRRKLISEVDFKSCQTGTLDFLTETNNEFYSDIKRSYGNFFADGKFSVQKIVQLK